MKKKYISKVIQCTFSAPFFPFSLFFRLSWICCCWKFLECFFFSSFLSHFVHSRFQSSGCLCIIHYAIAWTFWIFEIQRLFDLLHCDRSSFSINYFLVSINICSQIDNLSTIFSQLKNISASRFTIWKHPNSSQCRTWKFIRKRNVTRPGTQLVIDVEINIVHFTFSA